MKFVKIIYILIIILIFNLNLAHSNDKVSFINLDLLIQQTNIGKLILKDIEQINKKNIENLKIKESELKSIEDDIKKKKNIISKDEFENEVIRLRQNIKKFKNYKNKLVSEIENKKNNDIKEFFTKVNPIIQNYMDNNSIDILLERKNVFMSKNSSDITEKLIIEINKKFK
ncbi:OmpH family outer membrane protein [Pelagibacterales bacterium SAG-MED02]|jgi:outer membrane protein|nr:OmpH family outer membrane protein [Pelagibacterales bacterium SAG-MED02]|tara:strand:+ start:714 stop:1226 length:513 start_codon:yes stop_codon:yes gene_type:complete